MKYLSIIVLLLLTNSVHLVAAELPKQLNVLFIIIDDLCCNLSCYGDRNVQTPNIDRLAAMGLRFERAYCQWPVCNPSRTSFLTGKRPDDTGIFENQTPFRHKLPNIVTLPQLFRENGYYTVGLGKAFHKGIDVNGKTVFFQDPKSWDDCRNFDTTPIGKKGEGRNLTGGVNPAIHWLAAEGNDADQPDGQIAVAALQVLKEDRDKPLFLTVGFHKPHDPFDAPKKYFEQYPPNKIVLHQPPANRSQDLPMAIPKQSPFYHYAEKEAREMRRAYAACTSFTDAQVGKVLNELGRRKMWKNTIVVLMSDHGYHLGEHDWWNKVTLFEMCARVPLIVWVPGMKGMGKSSKGIVECVDLYPTLADLCGLKPPKGLAGTSFRPLLNDPTKLGKKAAYTQVSHGKFMGRSVRTERWRYTEWDNAKKTEIELYDHTNDELEYHNLAKNQKYKETMKELKALLLKTESKGK